MTRPLSFRQFVVRLLPLAVLVVLALPARAQLTPAEAAEAMGRGINLGNTMEPPTEGGWNNGPVQERYFDDYVAAGFSTVRVPVRWDRHLAKLGGFRRAERVWTVLGPRIHRR